MNLNYPMPILYVILIYTILHYLFLFVYYIIHILYRYVTLSLQLYYLLYTYINYNYTYIRNIHYTIHVYYTIHYNYTYILQNIHIYVQRRKIGGVGRRAWSGLMWWLDVVVRWWSGLEAAVERPWRAWSGRRSGLDGAWSGRSGSPCTKKERESNRIKERETYLLHFCCENGVYIGEFGERKMERSHW